MARIGVGDGQVRKGFLADHEGDADAAQEIVAQREASLATGLQPAENTLKLTPWGEAGRDGDGAAPENPDKRGV